MQKASVAVGVSCARRWRPREQGFCLVSERFVYKQERINKDVGSLGMNQNFSQWRIQGRGPPPPPIFRPNWGPKGRKTLFGDRPRTTPPPPPYLQVKPGNGGNEEAMLASRMHFSCFRSNYRCAKFQRAFTPVVAINIFKRKYVFRRRPRIIGGGDYF